MDIKTVEHTSKQYFEKLKNDYPHYRDDFQPHNDIEFLSSESLQKDIADTLLYGWYTKAVSQTIWCRQWTVHFETNRKEKGDFVAAQQADKFADQFKAEYLSSLN